MISQGDYSARAIEWAPGRTKNGDKILGVLFEVVEGESKGQKVQWTAFFTTKLDKGGKTSKERAVEAMKICGWDGTSNLSTLNKNVVSIKVIHRDFEDKTYAEVRFVNKLRAVRISNPVDDVLGFMSDIAEASNGKTEKPMRQPGDDFYDQDDLPL